MDEKSSLKVLMTSMIGIGHLNACIGIGSLLRKRGHQVYFAHFDVNKEVIEKHGFHYISLCEYNDKNYPIMNGTPPNVSEVFRKRFEMARGRSSLDTLKESMKLVSGDDAFTYLLEIAKGENCAMFNIIEKTKPDICLADYLWCMPWMVKAPCPVVPIISASPVDLYNGPPMGSGYSVHDSPQLWSEYRELKKEFEEKKIVEKAKELYKLFDAEFKSLIYAKQLGIYIFPGPLDYHELGEPKENWVRLDSSIRAPETQNFELPEKLKDKPGKLIYVSMGSLASAVTELLTMILTPLANSPHRFIVSTGVNGDSIKLHDNMWGDKFINQVALLPKVDLFITHGGTNSLIEGLAVGKPLIVIPQFGDQLDNAQRIADLGLGVRINLHELGGEKLLKAIEDVLNDEKIHSNVARVSEELKRTDSRDKVISLIEQLARNK